MHTCTFGAVGPPSLPFASCDLTGIHLCTACSCLKISHKATNGPGISCPPTLDGSCARAACGCRGVNVSAVLSFAADMATIGGPGSTSRRTFESRFKNDVAARLFGPAQVSQNG